MANNKKTIKDEIRAELDKLVHDLVSDIHIAKCIKFQKDGDLALFSG